MEHRVEKIANNLKKEKAETEIKIDAWKNVKIVTKKDGKSFKSMNRNFEGAEYGKDKYAIRDGENVLYVSGTKNGIYANDEINCYQLVKGLTDENKKAKAENYLPEEYLFEQIYEYDLDDIKQAIQERIEHLENYLMRLDKDIENAEKIYTDFARAHDIAMGNLKNDCETGYLEQMIRDEYRWYR